MFINKYLVQFMHGNEKLVLRACIYELILAALGTWISVCLALVVRIMLGKTDMLFFSNIYQLFLCIGTSLILRYIISKQKVVAANSCGTAIKVRLRQKLMQKLFELGPAFTVKNRTGDIACTIADRVEGLSYYYSLYLPTAVSACINALVLIIILFQLEWSTALICMVAFLCMLVCPMFFYRMMEERGKKEWMAHSEYYANCLDSIQGMTTLKAFHANEQRKEFVHEQGKELRRTIMEQLRITMLENGVLELWARIGNALSVAVAAVHITTVRGNLEDLTYIIFLVGACFAPMMNLTNAWHMGYRGVTASYSIESLLKQTAAFSYERKKSKQYKQIAEENLSVNICFDDVCFAYNPEEGDILHHVSFTVPAKTMTALVGTSGSGKSTIIHLLAGFYPVRTGTVTIGNKVLNENSLEETQNLISAVWQDSHMFYGTVKENIKMGREDASEYEIMEAAKKANIHDLIMTLPEKYDTMLGENGTRFSGGERQRIALARAFLKDSPILLFDEATSSLDRKNEVEIQQSFTRLRENKTTLVIAHRLATIQEADQICIVDNGKIVAVGTHAQLAETSSIYQSLMGDQMAGLEERN